MVVILITGSLASNISLLQGVCYHDDEYLNNCLNVSSLVHLSFQHLLIEFVDVFLTIEGGVHGVIHEIFNYFITFHKTREE